MKDDDVHIWARSTFRATTSSASTARPAPTLLRTTSVLAGLHRPSSAAARDVAFMTAAFAYRMSAEKAYSTDSNCSAPHTRRKTSRASLEHPIVQPIMARLLARRRPVKREE